MLPDQVYEQCYMDICGKKADLEDALMQGAILGCGAGAAAHWALQHYRPGPLLAACVLCALNAGLRTNCPSLLTAC